MREEEDAGWQRLDKFLVFARFCRTRETARALVAQGGLRINRQPTDKAHAKLRAGDVLTIGRAGGVVVVRIAGFARRRGPPEAARALYEELA
jgi:ribosome-associated heat shock protein Hsp15